MSEERNRDTCKNFHAYYTPSLSCWNGDMNNCSNCVNYGRIETQPNQGGTARNYRTVQSDAPVLPISYVLLGTYLISYLSGEQIAGHPLFVDDVGKAREEARKKAEEEAKKAEREAENKENLEKGRIKGLIEGL